MAAGLQMPDFKHCEVSHTLEVVDTRSTTFRSEHRFVVEALVPSRFFIRDYFWTGSGSEKETVPELVCGIDDWGFPQHRIHGPLITEGTSRILIVDLGRTINVGEKETVIFKHRMKDLAGTFQPFLAARPGRAIETSLTLRLILPSLPHWRVMYQRFTHDTDKVTKSERLTRSSGEPGRFVYEKVINNPSDQKMGHRLDWSKSSQ